MNHANMCPKKEGKCSSGGFASSTEGKVKISEKKRVLGKENVFLIGIIGNSLLSILKGGITCGDGCLLSCGGGDLGSQHRTGTCG